MVKIDLITGFLGSGKTTFLLKYAKYLLDKGQKIGILEYDYGAVNIDMLLLRQLQGDNCTLEMLAAACDEDCLRRRFKTKLIAMAMSGYDRVIIEPSGVFDMDMFFDTLRDEPLDNWYEIGSVITIVDARLAAELGLDKEKGMQADIATDYLLVSQTASAGTVLLSKTQLATTTDINATCDYISCAADRVHCRGFAGNYESKCWDDMSDDDYERLMNSGYHIASCDKSIVGAGTEFSSVSFLDIPNGLDSFKSKVERLFAGPEYGKILRVKGFVSDIDGKGYQVNATRGNINAEPMARGQGTVIVIGTDINKNAINELFLEA